MKIIKYFGQMDEEISFFIFHRGVSLTANCFSPKEVLRVRILPPLPIRAWLKRTSINMIKIVNNILINIIDETPYYFLKFF